MNIAVVGCDYNKQHRIKTTLCPHTIVFFNADTVFQSSFDSSNFQLLITFDLAGFNLKTLTNGIWYNLLPLKQIHVLTKTTSEELKKYFAKPLSINMFFYITSNELAQEILPYITSSITIRVIDNETTSTISQLTNIVDEVQNECFI